MAVALFVIVFGIIEIGRLLSASNVLTAATRNGARLAATTPAASRTTAVTASIQSEVASYFPAANVSVSVTSTTDANGQPVVTVSATGKISLLFLTGFGNSTLNGKSAMALTRSATFRDETVTL